VQIDPRTPDVRDEAVAVSKATDEEFAATDGDESLPEWKRQSVERSLQVARARAQDRSDRFVASASELMEERGDVDFTVQDIVDRAKMSIRTFYNFFASKDDVLVAVHETILATEVAPRLRKRCDGESDPVLKIRVYIEGIFSLTAKPGPTSRALTTFRNRLAETRPDDLDRAFRPQIELVQELVKGVSDAGRLNGGLSAAKSAYLIHHTVLAAVHDRILASSHDIGVTAEDLWIFCCTGIGADAGVKTSK
jgi:AcrR family transcriptional regulator